MEYHNIYQNLQFIKKTTTGLDDLPRDVRWCQHGPSVLYGFRRIKQLARLVKRTECASVQHAAKEVEVELKAIKERICSCILTQ
jgi:hypothetical protein